MTYGGEKNMFRIVSNVSCEEKFGQNFDLQFIVTDIVLF